MFDLNDNPHTRVNILTGERVLVSPHRSKRPWQGQLEDDQQVQRPSHDANCYLCAGNIRANGEQNPAYTHSFVFQNDFSALLPDAAEGSYNEADLLIAEAEKGLCKVISFSPRHDLTLPELSMEEITAVVDLWQSEYASLAANEWINYIQIFENKGSIMGCSNPHPHGQIWAQSSIPLELQKEATQQQAYYEKNGRTLLTDYVNLELKKQERILVETEHFVTLVPFWATWPFESMLVSKRAVQDILAFTAEEKADLALIIKILTTKYDNLFETSFPYSAGMHQAPSDGQQYPYWHWHMHFYPPLLRSATVKKFMVGYELLANPQRDITPELAAQKLRDLSTLHYKNK